MTSASSRRPVRVAALVALVLAVAAPLAGCRVPSQTPTPTPSTPGATPRPFTVMSTDPIRVTDPAAITDTDSTVIAQNVFQRLMTADPGGSVLKPDAARDCLFTAATTYSCTLNEKLQFHNGHPLTSSDVKFSIERATRLDVPGSSASLLSSLRRIDTPDDRTVRFLLSRPDTQFGWGLASSAASLVDEEVYNADRVHEPTDPVVGSGPFQLSDLQHRQCSALQVHLLRRAYAGQAARTGLPHHGRLGLDRGRHDQGHGRGGVARPQRGGRHPARSAGEAGPGRADRQRLHREDLVRRARPPAALGIRLFGAHATRRCGPPSHSRCRVTGPRTRWFRPECPGMSPAFRWAARPSPR